MATPTPSSHSLKHWLSLARFLSAFESAPPSHNFGTISHNVLLGRLKHAPSLIERDFKSDDNSRKQPPQLSFFCVFCTRSIVEHIIVGSLLYIMHDRRFIIAAVTTTLHTPQLFTWNADLSDHSPNMSSTLIFSMSLTLSYFEKRQQMTLLLLRTLTHV